MIISKTPYRISFFGGGTDYPLWYCQHGGSVLSTTIDKYCYISTRALPPFFSHKYRIAYSKIEEVSSLNEIQHPSVRAVLSRFRPKGGLEIHHDGDLPARSGIGSSSTFTVGLLNCVAGLMGKMLSKRELAETAIDIEQNLIGEVVGSQDQIAAAYGGLNNIIFKRCGGFECHPVLASAPRIAELNEHLMLFYTGVSRIASEVAKVTVKNMSLNKRMLSRMHEYVDEAIKIFTSESADISDFGRLLHDNWNLKRSLAHNISSEYIDHCYGKAISSGAIGGKILGAGGGGFLLIFAEPSLHGVIRNALRELIHVPFKFENMGTRIEMYNPNGFEMN